MGTTSKLEEKLIELGYEYEYFESYIKHFNRFVKIDINLTIDKEKINCFSVEYDACHFTRQKQIDNLQQAFDVMTRDLEILKEYENEQVGR